MFRVKNICVIIALFLLISCSIVIAEANNGKLPDNSTTKPGQMSSEDMMSDDGFTTDADNSKNVLQVNLAKKFTLAIGFVALLGCATFYFSKKVVPKLTASKGKSITITDSVSLGQNKTLHVVEIGNKKLLIGCTSSSINTLSDLTATFQEVLQTYQEDKNDE